MVSGMILATTGEIEGRPVREYFGIVAGEATAKRARSRATGEVGDRQASMRSSVIERQIRETRDRALASLIARAAALGATAVIAISIDYTIVAAANGDELLVISASGTAVLL
ncbi:MAG: heavy metal-binding domain-containing protein [Thermomicrobiales bacterium]